MLWNDWKEHDISMISMEKCLHYCWEIASSYPNNTTAFHGWQSREKNWPCSLGGRNGITPCPLSITAMLANHKCLWAHVWKRADSRICYEAPWCSKSSRFIRKRFVWLASCVSKEARASKVKIVGTGKFCDPTAKYSMYIVTCSISGYGALH